ncbi:MAG: hypothetical protein OEZ43_13500 [Gammaproteobacteria bacterium]|nr:hypothetical protein [Gammaproteobacteria bacterium]
MVLDRDLSSSVLLGTVLGSVTTDQTYNNFAELDSFTAKAAGSVIYQTQFTRDVLGRIVEKTETINGTTHHYVYDYDLAGRLVNVTKDNTSVAQYLYDDNGNRIGGFNLQGTINASYDAQDRLTQYGTTQYDYTANGELLAKRSGTSTVASYDYDVLGNLRAATLADGTNIHYIIDANNRRVGKKVNGALVQGFLYQDQLNPIGELDANGNVVARFVYGSKPNVPDYMIKNGSTYRLLSDHLGSPILVIDVQTNTIAQQMAYDEFGNVIQDSNPGFQPFGFAGGIYDQHTRLTRFGARDYDAQSGRWTAKDPIRFQGGDANLYGYVLGDGLNLLDPTGKIKIKEGPNGADISGLNYRLNMTFPYIDSAIRQNSNQYEGVITSGTDGIHMPGSLHYSGYAVDVRGNNFSTKQLHNIGSDLRRLLGSDYDVIVETYPTSPYKNHIHIEYQPKVSPIYENIQPLQCPN